jgi:hypothetical protein
LARPLEAEVEIYELARDKLIKNIPEERTIRPQVREMIQDVYDGTDLPGTCRHRGDG